VILLVSEANDLVQVFLVILAIVVGIAISYVGMKYASKISGFIGGEGLRVITKLMAIIVLAIAVQFVISGMTEAIPQILS